jgi:shikimate dehydrogenase
MITGTTKLVAIIGDPVDGSLSPVMQNAAFSALEIDWAYFAIRISSGMAAAAIDAARTIGLAGLNVTMPLKAEVIPYLDYVDPGALAARSVNTVVNNNGRLEGYSTDGEGFIRSLRDEGISLTGAHVVIIGAGGAARPIAAAVAGAGAVKITVICRNAAAGDDIARIIKDINPDAVSARFSFDNITKEDLTGASLIVNATPLGKNSMEGLTLLMDGIAPDTAVADLNTVPPFTAFLAAAQERGCAVISGRGMLVHQGSLSFKLWTGQDAPLSVMKQAVSLPAGEAGETP